MPATKEPMVVAGGGEQRGGLVGEGARRQEGTDNTYPRRRRNPSPPTHRHHHNRSQCQQLRTAATEQERLDLRVVFAILSFVISAASPIFQWWLALVGAGSRGVGNANNEGGRGPAAQAGGWWTSNGDAEAVTRSNEGVRGASAEGGSRYVSWLVVALFVLAVVASSGGLLRLAAPRSEVGGRGRTSDDKICGGGRDHASPVRTTFITYYLCYYINRRGGAVSHLLFRSTDRTPPRALFRFRIYSRLSRSSATPRPSSLTAVSRSRSRRPTTPIAAALWEG